MFIAAACTPGSLVASENTSGRMSDIAQHSRDSTDLDGCAESDMSQRDDLTMIAMSPAEPVGQAGAGAPSGAHVVGARGPATDWGPVWVRLSPHVDGVGGMEPTVILGEVNSGENNADSVSGQLAVGCATGLESLEAELVKLCIASGGKVRYCGRISDPACTT